MENEKDLSISSDGFIYYKGAKLPFKVERTGFEFFEKDKRRAAALGSQRFIVPFDELISFITALKTP